MSPSGYLTLIELRSACLSSSLLQTVDWRTDHPKAWSNGIDICGLFF
jgi:hypothetical protein